MNREDFRPWHCQAIAGRSDLPPSARHVYIVLAGRADNQTLKCWPSHETLARETGLSARTVGTAITKLVEHGYVYRKSGRTKRVVNVYTLNWSAWFKAPEPGPAPEADDLEAETEPEPITDDDAGAEAGEVDLTTMTEDELRQHAGTVHFGMPEFDALTAERKRRRGLDPEGDSAMVAESIQETRQWLPVHSAMVAD